MLEGYYVIKIKMFMNASINYATSLDQSPCGSQEPLQAGRNLLVSSFLREIGV